MLGEWPFAIDRLLVIVTTLIIGNSRTEEMVGNLAALTPAEREAGGHSAQAILWFAVDGDIVVVPRLPRPEYLAYVTKLTCTDPASLTILAPPPGVLGTGMLTPDRTADPDFRERLCAALRGRDIDQVLAVYKDLSTVELARAVGLEQAVPGHLFSGQGGDALVNSKAAFRAMAAAAGVPISPGMVVTQPGQAELAIAEMLASGQSVMLKQEFNGGGFGNEILSPGNGVAPAGALQVVVLSDARAVAGYVAGRWDWLTGGGRHRLVIERYLRDSNTVYAEYLIGDDGEELVGTGDILMEPVAKAEIVPSQMLSASTRATLVAAGRRLCQSYRAIGYRGYLSTDAVLTPAGEVVFTETNGRLSGSTHLHTVIGSRLLGPRRAHRVLLERWDWPVPSFACALERLSRAGLSYDPHTCTGVLFTSDLMPDSTLTYCVAAENLQSAQSVAQRLDALFAEPAR